MHSRALLLATLVALSLVALSCGEPDAPVSTATAELAHAGPWVIPPDVTAVADQQTVTVTDAGPWRGEAGCGGTFTAGARQLQDWIRANWPQVTGIGGYSCRPINGNNAVMSVHATGRALDVFIPLDNGEADNDLGDPLANWLIMHAEEIGIQRVIWDRWIWAPDRAVRGRAYNGAHPHHDHLHVELSVQAANLGTAFFQGPMGPPDMSACADPLPPRGGTIDDTSPCFSALGPAQYWRRVDGAGVGGRLLWTNAFSGNNASNWARWLFEVSVEREYDVEVNIVGQYAIYPAVRYEVRHRDGDSTVVIDPRGRDGWVPLGRFTFGEGEAQWVSVFDNYAGEVAANQSIVADAVRLTVPEAPPPPPPDAGQPPADAGLTPFDAGPPPADAAPAIRDADLLPDRNLTPGADQGPPPPDDRPDEYDDDDFDDVYEDAGPVRLPSGTRGVSNTGGCQATGAPGGALGLFLLLGLRRWRRSRSGPPSLAAPPGEPS